MMTGRVGLRSPPARPPSTHRRPGRSAPLPRGRGISRSCPVPLAYFCLDGGLPEPKFITSANLSRFLSDVTADDSVRVGQIATRFRAMSYPPRPAYLPPPSAPPVPEGTQFQDPPKGQSAMYVRALALPTVIAEALLRLDDGCAPWICACLVEMLDPGFQLYRLRFHSVSLWLYSAAGGAHAPGARLQRTSVMLCDVPVNPPAGQEYYRDVWRELVNYFRGHGPAVPAHLIPPSGARRVRASLTALYLNIVPEAFKRQNDLLVADTGGPFSHLSNGIPKWLEGKGDLPEHVVRHTIRFFAEHADYVMTPSVIAEPKKLKKIVLGVVGVPVGSVPHVLSNADLDLFALNPMGDRHETVTEDQSNIVLEIGGDATAPEIRRGARGGRQPMVADQNGLLVQVRLLLNTYLIASWVRCQHDPSEDRGWLEPRQIDEYINNIVSASEKVKTLTLRSMVSVVFDQLA